MLSGLRLWPGSPCRRRTWSPSPGRSPLMESSWSGSSASISPRSSLRSASIRVLMVDLEGLTLTAAGDLLASGSVSSIELTEAILHRVEETEPVVHAYATVMGEQ